MTDRIDPERARGANAFEKSTTFSGQGYHRDFEAEQAAAMPAGSVNEHAPLPPGEDGADIPPENGRRASFDPKTGEVHGSGVGAGGGERGEDYDSDANNAAGYPLTGSEGR